MITGDDIRLVLHDESLSAKANANERDRLGLATYYLTVRTYEAIAARLNDIETKRSGEEPPLMVPRNPTDDMVQAGLYQFKLGGDEWATVYQIWTDMFTALTMDGGCIDRLPVAPPEAITALATIKALIGNVDHSRGHGPNAAEMRGGMLNDIRDVATKALQP